jgi:tyrosyl-tRNA synthetase
MGRNETDELSAAQIFYPCMQCADIFFLKADICQLGMDQRKVGQWSGREQRLLPNDSTGAYVLFHD